jgi:hypothetical protein
VPIRIVDHVGRHRLNLQLSLEPPTDVSDRSQMVLDGVEAWWKQDFTDVPGARPVTNAIARFGDVEACGAGYEEPDLIASVLASLSPE